MKHILMVAAIVAIALAGCVGDDDNENPGTPAKAECEFGYVDEKGVNVVDTTANVMPYEFDADLNEWTALDPWNAEYTNFRTCTLEEVGHHPLRFNGDTPDPHKYLGEIDMRGDLNLGAVAVLGNGEDPMVYLLDITNRTHPEVLSVITQFDTYVVDVKISDDGNHLFTASQNIPAGAGAIPTDPLAVTPPTGFTIYDISDPADPVFQQFVVNVDDIGCHMISHEVIDGTEVVFCVGQHVSAHGFVPVADGLPWAYLGAFQYLLPDGSGTLAPGACVNDLIAAGDPTGLLCSGPHDMTVAVDPVDGNTYMTVSHWNEGLRVVDVSAPVTDGFVTVGSWNGEGATHYDGNVHTAMMAWVGDTRYVIATPEMTYSGVVPAMWVLNATDLSNMELVAEWYNPQEIPTPGLLTTLHQWQVAPTGPDVAAEDVNIYITMNHAGLWVLDFERILAGDLVGAIGGFHMARGQLDQSTAVGNAILSTWDVNVVDGFIYGSDRATGLWIFDYTEDAYADPALTGFA